MSLNDFDFTLPKHLIAQHPPRQRDGGRFMTVDDFCIHPIKKIAGLFGQNDVVVINDSKVVPARLLGKKTTGGQVEIFLERFLSDSTFLAQIKASKGIRCPATLHTAVGDFIAQAKQDDGFYQVLAVSSNNKPANAKHRFIQGGQMPLPPYIRRPNQTSDRTRYQTVYAKPLGSVAAPTAGLHLTTAGLKQIEGNGARLVRLTLHVGAGTFTPIRDALSTHKMHTEFYHISPAAAHCIQQAKENGQRITAIGTTVLRALESAWHNGRIQAGDRQTNLFIQPGYRFRVVDSLFTNFHLPRSSLFVLVCAFAGTQKMQDAYRHAIAQQMRFFSYGDAMYIHRPTHD